LLQDRFCSDCESINKTDARWFVLAVQDVAINNILPYECKTNSESFSEVEALGFLELTPQGKKTTDEHIRESADSGKRFTVIRNNTRLGWLGDTSKLKERAIASNDGDEDDESSLGSDDAVGLPLQQLRKRPQRGSEGVDRSMFGTPPSQPNKSLAVQKKKTSFITPAR
jgi:hypothetical protein